MQFQFLLFSFLFISIQGHAILRVPLGWNTNPSKTSPCGAGVQPTVPDAIWKVGTTVTITWQVVASDGSGAVTVTFDPTGQMNFVGAPQSLISTIGTAPMVGTFNFSLTIPSVTCTGPDNMCSVQFMSSSAWFSCTSVQLVTTPPPPVITTPTCEIATGMKFCTQLNNQFVLVPHGQTAAGVDSEVSSTYSANVINPNVFTFGNSSACGPAYKNFLCSQTLPYCGTQGACQAICNYALQTCGLTQKEADLYNCGLGPISCCQNGTLPCANPIFQTGPTFVPIIPHGDSTRTLPVLYLFVAIFTFFSFK